MERATTSIYIRVKRFAETYFILCDEYETIESLKNRLIVVLQRMKFELPKQEEPFTVDDLRFCIKNRVSFNFHFNSICRFWITPRLAMTNRFSMTQYSTYFSVNLALKTNSTSQRRSQDRNSLMTTLLRKKMKQQRSEYRI